MEGLSGSLPHEAQLSSKAFVAFDKQCCFSPLLLRNGYKLTQRHLQFPQSLQFLDLSLSILSVHEMSYTLTKGSQDELYQMMQILIDGWRHDNLWEPAVRGGTSDEDQIQWFKAIFEAAMSEPWHEYIKVVDDSTGYG